MSYLHIPTLAGQAAIAAAIAGTAPLDIASVVVGDGGGAETTPLETQTSLVNPRATVPITSIVRAGNITTVKGVLDQETGGWWVRETGILSTGGTLLFVSSAAPFYKPTLDEGVDDVTEIGARILVSALAQISLVLSSEAYATQAWVTENFVRKPAPFLFFGTM